MKGHLHSAKAKPGVQFHSPGRRPGVCQLPRLIVFFLVTPKAQGMGDSYHFTWACISWNTVYLGQVNVLQVGSLV